jgi:Lipocalin-like domain
MKALLRCAVVAAVALSGWSSAQSADKKNAESSSVREQLVGAWHLAWTEEGTDRKMTRISDREGTLLYSSDGHMSVQIMLPKRDDAPQGNPVKYDQSGYEAYFGTFDVNEQAHTVTHHVQGALVRGLIGKDLTRVYHFSGRQLILRSSRPDEHWTIAWEHY